jgi:integrase
LIKTKYTGVYYRDTQNKDRVHYITYKINGKLKKEKVGTNKEGITAVYASKYRAKKISEHRLGNDAPLHKKDIPTLDIAAKDYLEKIEGKGDTKNSKGRYNNHIKPVFGDRSMDSITTDEIEKFYNKKRKEISLKTKRVYAPKTINDLVDLISIIYNHVNDKFDLKLINPASNKKFKKENPDNDRERYLEAEEIPILFDAINNRKNGKDTVTSKINIFTALSLMTGARLVSVLTITKADVLLKQNRIIIKNHKSNRTYMGYIHPKYKKLIEDRIKDLKPTDYVVSGTSSPGSRSSVNKVLQPILNKLFNDGIPEEDTKRRAVIHTLRHTFASLLAIDGVPIYTISKLMDHSGIEETMKYAKLQPDQGADAVAALPL